jgi:alpha-beta hydrolase superfamily lysophospholipase
MMAAVADEHPPTDRTPSDRTPADQSIAVGNIPGMTPILKRRMRTLFRIVTALSPALAVLLAARLFITPLARRISDEDAQFLTSAASRRLATAHGDVQIYEWPGQGPAVLMLHGWISYAARLSLVIEALRARGLRVVAFDAPAHGRSAGKRADLYSFRDALAAVSNSCGPPGAIFAHSFGALTAASWLAENAAGSNLRAAVLVGLPRDVGFLFESFTIAMGLRADVIQRLRARFRTRYGARPEDYSAQTLAQRIHIPVLIIHGGADELVPAAHAEQVALQLRDGRVQVIPGLNHSAPLRDPETVQLMANFIAARMLA